MYKKILKKNCTIQTGLDIMPQIWTLMTWFYSMSFVAGAMVWAEITESFRCSRRLRRIIPDVVFLVDDQLHESFFVKQTYLERNKKIKIKCIHILPFPFGLLIIMHFGFIPLDFIGIFFFLTNGQLTSEVIIHVACILGSFH